MNTEKTTNTPIKINKGFYQNISSLPSLDENIYLSIENQSKKDVCMIYISLFKLEDKNSGEIISGIILDENITQPFLFNKNLKKIKYYYFHTESNKDINITLSLLNEGNYQLNLLNKSYNFSSNYTILVEHKDWKNICKESQHVPYIFFYRIILYC